MADPDDEESWYSVFTAAGYEVECVLDGLGQLPAIQELFVAHTQAAIVAGMIHTGEWTIGQIKSFLSSAGIPVRRTW